MQPFIVISPRAGQRWLWAGDDGTTGSGSLEDLAAWYAGRETPANPVLLVPGEEVLLARIGMPTRNPSRVARALPFALEEHVLDDPANLHCVPGSWADQETMACAAINRGRLQALLTELGGQGIVPDSACPDSLCIPWRKDTIQVVSAAGRTLVRWGECSAAACEESALDIFVEGIKAGQETGQLPVEHQQVADDTALLTLCAKHAGRLPLDLLQGEFLPVRRKVGWRSWRLPAALAASVLLLAIVFEGLQNRKLSRDSSDMSGAISEQFRTAFPHIGRVQSDPGPQIELELRRLRQQAGAGEDLFLDLLGRVAPALAASPALSLEGLQYRDGQLELRIVGVQIADLDTLRARLQAAGITASQGAAQLDNDRVSGTITVSSPTRGGGS
jgi:general secretion pathway protein L